jgi:hypothetical protein
MKKRKVVNALKPAVHILGIATLAACALLMAFVMLNIQIHGSYMLFLEPNLFIRAQEIGTEIFGACYAVFLLANFFSTRLPKIGNNNHTR